MQRAIVFAGLLFASALFGGVAAKADDLIEDYTAFIGQEDLYNSNGTRLTQPWQIIRQDRANFHRYNISQRGDQSDGFFSDANNRELLEGMISRGSTDKAARAAIIRGNVMINVRIFRGRRGDYVDVLVY